MSDMKTTLVIVLFFMVSLERTSSNQKTQTEIPSKVNIKRSYADLLGSLIEVNKERVKALKKLYLLNSVTYGKNALRSNFEQRLDEYDKMEASLIRTLKRILDEIKNTPKASIGENDVKEILKTDDDIFVLSNSEDIYTEPIEMNNQLEMRKLKNVLRNGDSGDDTSKEEDNSGYKADSKSSSIEKENEKFEKSLEKENEEFENEVNSNRTKGRSYYIIEYGCGRGRVRCIKACKEAYRYACDIYDCRSSLRSELRHSCKIECRDWFY